MKRQRTHFEPIDPEQTVSIDTHQIPDYSAEELGRVIYQAAQRAWQDPEFRERYYAWKRQRDAAGGATA